MANLSAVTTTDIHVVESIKQITLPAAEAITKGQAVGFDSNGKAALADADAVVVARGIAISAANQANIAITVLQKGVIDMGDIFTSMAFGDSVYTSATAGLLADASVNSQPAIGIVEPAWGYSTADKLLYLDL